MLLVPISTIMKRRITILAPLGLALLALLTNALAQGTNLPAQSAQYEYPFRNPDLPLEERVNNAVSLIMGETWDTEVLSQAGAVEGYEVRFIFQREQSGRGGLIVRAPNADLGRDPRWGRTEECYGEDPFFNGTMAVAFIKGLQGDHAKYWLTASLLKHFLANSNEDGRTGTSSDFDERLFREYYSVPFRMGFEEGGARCFMTAYNLYNHIPCTVHPVVNLVAVKEWGVDGVICTDGGASANLTGRQHYYTNTAEAGAGEIKAGINQFLDNTSSAAVRTAIQSNLLAEAELDKVIKGTLWVFIRLGWLDPTNRVPYASIGAEGEPWPATTDKHKAIARLATRKSIVLLKNSNKLLPLDRAGLKSIAVVGPRASEVLLDWYSGTPPYTVTPLDGIRARAGPGIAVNCATNNDHGEAVNLARAAEVAIVCVGNNPIGVPGGAWERVSVPSEGREAVDRKAINLEQEELIQPVFAANPKTIVVLISSFPYAINWTQEHVPAIVHLTQSSQELGNALAEVLFGDYNPAGRLVQTWPRSLEQLPPMMDYDIRHGRTYMYFKGEPLYPFGYGLSYTTFEYSNLRTSAPQPGPGGAITVSVDVKNSGDRPGEEVVQLYVRHIESKVQRPGKELRGFKRVALQPGARKTVELPLPTKSLAYWDVERHAFALESGKVELLAGSSSADIRLKTSITVNN